jgi:hypothetical protein
MLQITEGYKDFSGLSGVQGAIDATEIHIQVQCAKIYTYSIPSV